MFQQRVGGGVAAQVDDVSGRACEGLDGLGGEHTRPAQVGIDEAILEDLKRRMAVFFVDVAAALEGQLLELISPPHTYGQHVAGRASYKRPPLPPYRGSSPQVPRRPSVF